MRINANRILLSLVLHFLQSPYKYSARGFLIFAQRGKKLKASRKRIDKYLLEEEKTLEKFLGGVAFRIHFTCKRRGKSLRGIFVQIKAKTI